MMQEDRWHYSDNGKARGVGERHRKIKKKTKARTCKWEFEARSLSLEWYPNPPHAIWSLANTFYNTKCLSKKNACK